MIRFISVFLLLVMFFVAGCNTVQGVGKDIESAGKAIQRSSQ
ncbi:MAG: entericidin A/B family lipoprotein [Thermodesulfovibrionales bacterium]|nr:entericidin A/B family lipoprotein [Thermodesulfovibrionales bacterium]